MLGAMEDAKTFLARLDATKAILDVVAGRNEYDKVVENETSALLSILEHIVVSERDAASIIHGVKVS